MWNEHRIRSFRMTLLRWYRRHKRDLPWRRNINPYRTWVSEIMLQQTQTSAVVPFYERFLEQFPDIRSLAQATEPEVVNAWAGLGYYSRARNLLRAAKQIVKFHGAFPRDFNALLRLPGVGRYTAGAICSIAFNQPTPVVDGNVRRVLARLTGIKNRIPEKVYWELMSTWISRKAPSSFNQAMMELGALVCIPVQPRCPQCPVREFCTANRLGIEASIPKVRKKQARHRIKIVVLVIQRNNGILLVPAGKNSFIPGSWELPWQLIPDHASKEKIAAALCRNILGQDFPLEYCGDIRHCISIHQITGFTYHARTVSKPGPLARNSLRWANPSSLGKLLTSSLFHKVLRQARDTRVFRQS
jgi:A/G-specific adenine glycosylase